MSNIGLLLCLGATLLVGWALLTWAARWSEARAARSAGGEPRRQGISYSGMENLSSSESWWDTVADERSGWTNGDFLAALDVLNMMNDEG